MPAVYFLFSEKDQQWYIGQTSRSVEERFREHAAGYVRATKPRRPLRLAYVEVTNDQKVAKKREWFLKHPSGYREKLMIVSLLIEQKPKWPLFGTVVH
jgi:predicted GIY-YIG superfamily endonuclease